MNKTKLVLVGLIVTALCFASFVYALTALSWNQNPQVPTGSFTAYYETTPILEGSNQTAIWKWDGLTYCFNTTITIKNDGVSTIKVKVEYSGLDPLWTAYGSGTTVPIAAGGILLVPLAIRKPSALSGEPVGSFTITMTIVP